MSHSRPSAQNEPVPPPSTHGKTQRKAERPPCGPGGPESLQPSYGERTTSVLARIKIACRALVEEGVMPTTRKVADRAPCGTSTLGRGRHAEVFQRYRRFAERKGLGSAARREARPSGDRCAGCRRKDGEIEKLTDDARRLAKIVGVLRKLVRWHRSQMAEARARYQAQTLPDLPRRSRIPR